LDGVTTFFVSIVLQPSITSGISMTQILKGRFDGSKAGHRGHPVSLELLTERQTLDENGRRVLVGLTAAETREFETLDSLPPSDGSGNRIAWTFGGDPTTSREKRWLELYTRHDEAWKTGRTRTAARVASLLKFAQEGSALDAPQHQKR
jgi:hypothetical protein